MGQSITIVGLGAAGLDEMTLGIYRMVKEAKHVYVRTMDHPAVQELEQEGVTFTAFDEVYEKHDDFQAVYEEIAAFLFDQAASNDILYAVPGHPLVAEQTVQLLLHQCEEKGITVTVAGGKSFLDEMYTALKIDPIDGCQILDGTNLKRENIVIRQHAIIVQVYDAFIASEVKLTLMEKYKDDHEVAVVTAAGSRAESITWVKLYELDHALQLNNLTAVYVPPVTSREAQYRDFDHLREVIAVLRSPEGCPWDRKQTHQSLKKYLLEEAYEVLEAIDEADDDHLAEELGDVLLQVLLHAQIGEEEGYFSIDDVIAALASKMIRRHPHVFADVSVQTAEDVVKNWDAIKAEEHGERPSSSALDGITKGLPALSRAQQLQAKAAKVGFDWTEPEPIIAKLREEFDEWNQAESEDERLKEFGDIVFTIVNLGRYYGIDVEEALTSTNQTFQKRFTYIEQALLACGKTPQEATLEEMDALWNKAKENL
ncbi:tetrapyrrole methylase/MazG family protein [Fictibacillus macauensis ZFHKF-1]|uniref:Tetrapyrrole methylase/MazG family protein n=1 Tax=Fictibacillus macauensis ZFHKF-1 TaxID=1196324 RepID=I8AFN4_9BACL|nr:nucleoside triphosphate pyrophosphohydrolase [Fictibacillus macauensis]EIT84179.1 tetrapyrrole methylase/MazG family protein [Fictibacillus macauensis ZFHKF-1]